MLDFFWYNIYGDNMNLGLISLGCAKNKIDSEMFLGVAKKYGLNIVYDLNEADIIVVNTCGFIESAKKEAIDTILEVCEYKKNNVKIIAMGCLVERYLDDLKKEIPEVDIYFPIRDYDNIDNLFKELTASSPNYKMDYKDRIITTSNYSAYLKIGEGCNNRCTYCAIPLIRGNYRSRDFDECIAEAKFLAEKGIKEITLIAQDTTMYGRDNKNNPKYLHNLLHEISLIGGIKWIRVLYLYPDEITKDLINEIKNNKKVVKYFDIPLQHSSDKILKDMHRRGNKELITSLINDIRTNIPDAVIRTTFIVGFPGENNDDFIDLYNFVNDIKFDRLGCFTYSDEEDTAAISFSNKISEKIKQNRLNKIMKLQKDISLENNKKLIGKHFNVIIDNYDEEMLAYTGRSYMYAPDDVDGVIYIYSPYELSIGDMVEVEIVNANNYDLDAKLVNINFNDNIL